MLPPRGRDRVRLPPRPRSGWPDPPVLFQPRDRAIKRPRAQLHTRERLDVLHHRVAVFIAFSQARQDQ